MDIRPSSDALRRLRGRDQARGLAFVFRRFAKRSGFQGVRLSPGVIKLALETPPEELLAQGWDRRTGRHTRALTPQYEMLIAAARRTADVLGPEDVSQLERGTAKAGRGTIGRATSLARAHLLTESLSRHRPRRTRVQARFRPAFSTKTPIPWEVFRRCPPTAASRACCTRNWPSWNDRRPDLFDIKYLRDELLYYARDENQFLRRRRTFVFVLYPDLDQTRFKDRGLEYQRGVLLLALLYVLVGKLAAWLRTDALSFRFVFVGEGDNDPLRPERDLLASLLREEIALGSAYLSVEPENKIAVLCAEWRGAVCVMPC